MARTFKLFDSHRDCYTFYHAYLIAPGPWCYWTNTSPGDVWGWWRKGVAPLRGHSYLAPVSHSGKPPSFRKRKFKQQFQLRRKKFQTRSQALDSHITASLFIFQCHLKEKRKKIRFPLVAQRSGNSKVINTDKILLSAKKNQVSQFLRPKDLHFNIPIPSESWMIFLNG